MRMRRTRRKTRRKGEKVEKEGAGSEKEKEARRRRTIKKSGNRAGLSMRRVAGSTQINGRHEGQFFADPKYFSDGNKEDTKFQKVCHIFR